MEDISRELEREIAQIKPAAHKMRKGNSILIINDFGEIRSGAFLKVLVLLFLGISLAGGLSGVTFYRLYSKARNQNVQLKNSQDVFEKKVDRLTREKELLMARLVVTGNTAELQALTRTGQIGRSSHKKEMHAGSTDARSDSEIVKGEHVGADDKNSAPGRVRSGERASGAVDQSPAGGTKVGIEAFSLSPGNNPQDVVVRFEVKNTTQNAKEISGRIFCVLKPKGVAPDKWIMIPKASKMKSGVPGPYKQGHYFSISHFKPVQFTINTPTPLGDFFEVSVFIFDETKKLLLKTTFDTEKKKQD